MFCYFVSDLHGKLDRYEKLFNCILDSPPDLLFLGGDLFPHSYLNKNFQTDYLIPSLSRIKEKLGDKFPEIFIILGNDDAAREEPIVLEADLSGLWHYIHLRKYELNGIGIFGYSFTPPSPFLLKDWEKYDVSRYVELGSISPEEGKRTVEIPDNEKKFSTIREDLEILTRNEDLSNSVFLFHGPPYNTSLDRAFLDGKRIEYTEMDLHVGSIAIKKMIEDKQPLVTLHGHIHESARLTGNWKEKIGNTVCLGAAHDGPELALIKFDTGDPGDAERILQ
jgi:uncharacterized protein